MSGSTFEEPLLVKAAESTLDTWVRANVDIQALPRSVWQDLAAKQGPTPRVFLPPDNGPGREIVYPVNLRPNLVEYILYETTVLLQAKVHIALSCPLIWRLFQPRWAMCCVNVAGNMSSPCVRK